MDTKSIRCFCYVYEEKSIHKAAKQLYITPQGLSKIIQNLEQELKVQLFERSSKGMIATEAGSYFYANSQELFNQLEKLEIGIRSIRDKKQRYGIGFACGVLNFFSFQKISQLSSIYPFLQIQWEEASNDEIIEKIKEEKLKFGFVIGNQNVENLKWQEIFCMKPDVIVYPGHPFYEKKSVKVEELRGEKLITLNEKFYSYHCLVGRCEDCGFDANIVAKTMESHLIYRFVRENNGIGIDVNIHRDDILMGNLKRIPLENAFLWKIHVVYKQKKRDKKENQMRRDMIQYFCDSIKD